MGRCRRDDCKYSHVDRVDLPAQVRGYSLHGSDVMVNPTHSPSPPREQDRIAASLGQEEISRIVRVFPKRYLSGA